MTHQNPLQLLETLRLKREEYQIEPFVLDFLEIWSYVHEKAKDATLDDLWDILQSMKNTHTLPFYQKHKEKGSVELNEAWFKDNLSITLWWGTRGGRGILFPSTLITFEICHRGQLLLEVFVKRILTKETKGKREALFEFLLPTLFNFLLPLDEMDITILKSFQVMARLAPSAFKEPSRLEYAKYLKLSPKTFSRRMKTLDLLQMMGRLSFVDMGRLGYETTLLIHSNPFPEEHQQYLLFSTNLTVGRISIVQIPLKKPHIKAELFEQLELSSQQQMTQRISSWNLSQMVTGDERWREPIPVLHVEEDTITHPSPDLDFSLIPPDTLFRPLTPADIKIIDFIAIQGSFHNITHLSQTIKVSRAEVSKRLQEYSEERLLVKMHQYYKIGLDVTLFFLISTENSHQTWIRNFFSFPKAEVFYQEDQLPHYYYGYLKLPDKWLKPFARQVDLITQDSKVKFYYKIASSVDFFRWGISLADTYT